MHQEATTENNYREYNIFNKQSGQSYVVSYDVNHNEDSCTCLLYTSPSPRDRG